jgi:flagellar hook-basal body complex protein FliE
MSSHLSLSNSIRPPDRPTPRLMPKMHAAAGNAKGTPSVLDLMIDKAGEVNNMQHRADSMVHEMLTGGDVNSAEVLTSVQKADMAFRTLLQVRNKLIEAYREVLQIQV